MRTNTRSVERSRRAMERKEYDAEVLPLANAQGDLLKRIKDVVKKIKELPESDKHFARELTALANATDAMSDATLRLKRPDTGPMAIGAESEAIEHLLQARRSKGGSGAGGSTPGAGGLRKGQTNISALALAGRGLARDEKHEERKMAQGGGRSEDDVPEELRSALDHFFSELEQK